MPLALTMLVEVAKKFSCCTVCYRHPGPMSGRILTRKQEVVTVFIKLLHKPILRERYILEQQISKVFNSSHMRPTNQICRQGRVKAEIFVSSQKVIWFSVWVENDGWSLFTLCLDIAIFKKNVKESISNKSVKIFRNAVTIKTVIKDILKDVKSIAVNMHTVSKVIIPTRTRSRLNVKRAIY